MSGAISYGACEVAHRVGARAIVSATFSGATARAVARNLPAQPIVAVSPNPRVVNQLALCWGAYPLLGTDRSSFEEVIREANDLVLAHGFGERGQVVVVTAGLQSNRSGTANLDQGSRARLERELDGRAGPHFRPRAQALRVGRAGGRYESGASAAARKRS